MSFVVDGDDWSLDGQDVKDIELSIDKFISLLQTIASREEQVWIGENFQTQKIYDDCDIWSLGNSPAFSAIGFELWQELAAVMSRLDYYLDEPDWPDGFIDPLITIDEVTFQERPDVSWVHHSVRSGTPMGCIGLTTFGTKATKSNLGEARIHWINSATQLSNFWRENISLNGTTFQRFLRFAPHAYPEIYFHNGALAGAESLGGGYSANAELIAKYLAGINDYGAWIFTTPPPALTPHETAVTCGGSPSNQIIENRFCGIGLTVSPENPNVYKDGKCKAAREITIKKDTLYCEWHGKLEGHRNRIHIHAPTKTSGNKVVVAYICHHLPLP